MPLADLHYPLPFFSNLSLPHLAFSLPLFLVFSLHYPVYENLEAPPLDTTRCFPFIAGHHQEARATISEEHPSWESNPMPKRALLALVLREKRVAREGRHMLSEWLLILELLLWLAAPLGAYMLEANSSPPLTCTSVPYPFGISGKAMKGFEISCNWIDGTSPILQLGKHFYQIEDISLQGYLSIYTHAIAQNYDRNYTQVSGWIDLEGTPYTISDTENSGNKLTTVGCEVVVLLQGLQSTSSSSSCTTFCNSDIVVGSCSGVGCCQASIPKGLKSFNLTIESVRRLPSKVRSTKVNTTCSRTFIVTPSNFTFSNEILQDVMEQNQVSNYTYLMALDWAIGNETCEEAMRKMETYACKENSYCYNSNSGIGYRCNCSQGYHGNPYVEDGCEDFNECEDPELNPCVGLCINEPGNVSCACPPGQHGDGRKQGSGCTKKEKDTAFPLELALGNIFKFYYCRWELILKSGDPPIIHGYKELEKATNNFNESQILGHGGYGTVYKGVLPSLEVVAIKKSKFVDESQIEQFINEIIILSQINHRNVVRLLGCCLETQVPLLVYEFISNGTLFHHIHGDSHDFSMPWEVRLRIAAEAAGALAYLHSAALVPIIHRDVKSTNILLDENYTAKVSDFGASRLVPFDQTHITTLVHGTFGYLDPEYFHTSMLTEKSDVYSFGVVLAELLTRETPISFTRSEDQRNLAIYFTLMFDEQHYLQLLEPQIVEQAGIEQLFLAAQLARRCLNLKGEGRPTMKEVAMELEGLRRFHKQQLVPNLKEMEHSIDEIGSSKICIEEESR
uniref:Wall-associated receptor kinase 3-like n=1 Tax=Elaeis guineensis var. tenera TaxID=51953 RepID=A0A6J0PIV1_ELAGV|nr:wall-associated receptor kinase 3-like [Elaeis guineensis]